MRIYSQAEQYPWRIKHAVPEDVSRQWAVDALRSITRQNEQRPFEKAPDDFGATIRHHPGDGPTSGYMVSQPGTEDDETPFSRVHPKDIERYVTEHKDLINEPDNFYGSWVSPRDDRSPDTPYLFQDVSRNYADPWEAARAALAGEQYGIYDLDRPQPTYVSTPDMVNQAVQSGIQARRRARRHR